MFYVADDPGIPLGEWDDPLAGLSRDVGRALLEGVNKFDADDEFTVRTRGDSSIKDMLAYIAKTAAIGHSFDVVVDPDDSEYRKTFDVDGDGPFRMVMTETGWAGFPMSHSWGECNDCAAKITYDKMHDARMTLRGAYVGMCDGPDEWWCSRCYPDWLSEGKAIGTAGLGGDVAARDAVIRRQARGNVSYHIRQASRNANRDLREVYAEVGQKVGRLLSDWVAGEIRISQLRAESVEVWTNAYQRAREIGRKASGVERFHPQPGVLSEEETWFRSAVREEMRYWNLFLEEMLAARRGRRLDEGRMWERLAAYTKALRFMYEAARVQALPDSVLFYWMGPKPVSVDPRQERRICKGCTWLMEHSPFTKDTLPAVPRDGSTSCLTNCRHRLVVRVADPLDVTRRRGQLASRPSLIRQLRERKNRDHGTWRQERAREVARTLARRVSNPFAGIRLPTNPTMHRGSARPDERLPMSESERAVIEAELLGPIPIEHRLRRVEEDIYSNMQMRHLDLIYVARQLESQLRTGPVDPRAVQPLLNRFVGALEATVMASQGESEAQRFSRAMGAVVGRLWQAVGETTSLAESDAGLVLGAAAGAF